MKQLRKKEPKVQLLFASSPDDELSLLARSKSKSICAYAARLYDEVWPRWRLHGTVQISLQFLSEEEMARINGEYRGINASTDVLTFPLYENEGRFEPEEGLSPIILGDIVFCTPVITRNALLHGVSTESELALVIFHGMLHLLAWDHDTPEKESVMWKVQERYRDMFLAECE